MRFHIILERFNALHVVALIQEDKRRMLNAGTVFFRVSLLILGFKLITCMCNSLKSSRRLMYSYICYNGCMYLDCLNQNLRSTRL